jgi:hypothetical protein
MGLPETTRIIEDALVGRLDAERGIADAETGIVVTPPVGTGVAGRSDGDGSSVKSGPGSGGNGMAFLHLSLK